MVERRGLFDVLFDSLEYIILALLALACVLPFIHVISVAFSGRAAVSAKHVSFWPIATNFQNFVYIGRDRTFLGSFGVSLSRVIAGVSVSLFVTVLTAYPLSRDNIYMPGRTAYKLLMLISMLFSGGLIPTYLAVRSLGLINSFWVLILPGAFAVFNTILILNFFRGLPKEMYEAAVLDGAGHFDVLFRIFLPLSLPSLATVTLFSAVGHWNAWFDGMLYMDEKSKWPLQTLMYIAVQIEHFNLGSSAGEQAMRFQESTPEGQQAAMIMIATLPIMLVYPFLQRYFVTGLTLGAVKG